VIILTGHGDMQLAVRAMKGGAVDCLAKPFNDQELLDRIHHAIALDRKVRRERAISDEIAGRIGLLTDREREVMSRVVRGMTNQMIGEELGITKKTVDAHRARVMEKTRAKSLADLVQIDLRAREAAGFRDGAPDSGTV
jgi:FixJ family two-component response regulator